VLDLVADGQALLVILPCSRGFPFELRHLAQALQRAGDVERVAEAHGVGVDLVADLFQRLQISQPAYHGAHALQYVVCPQRIAQLAVDGQALLVQAPGFGIPALPTRVLGHEMQAPGHTPPVAQLRPDGHALFVTVLRGLPLPGEAGDMAQPIERARHAPLVAGRFVEGQATPV